MASLGFVGLGVMGSQVVNRLLSKGHSVIGYNRTRSKAEWLIERGMKWADSPKSVAQNADVTFAMVTNSAALTAITSGRNGLLAGPTKGKDFRRHEHREPHGEPRARCRSARKRC
jgi:3-hydroxyisobutyrate dehydrogenase-like beta-hydroxyacid dehydrogenase